jgi:DNA-binding MarR family transcriptional regulator
LHSSPDATSNQLAKRLGISTASTTVLIDRLERSGHLARRPHPTDRRSLVVIGTTDSDAEVRKTLGRMHRAMIDVADALEPQELVAVARFLSGMVRAVELADADGRGHAEAGAGSGPASEPVARRTA